MSEDFYLLTRLNELNFAHVWINGLGLNNLWRPILWFYPNNLLVKTGTQPDSGWPFFFSFLCKNLKKVEFSYRGPLKWKLSILIKREINEVTNYSRTCSPHFVDSCRATVIFVNFFESGPELVAIFRSGFFASFCAFRGHSEN